MSESSPSTSEPTRKDSNGSKKGGRLFRMSTLFPQATFMQQLGLDKLKSRESPQNDNIEYANDDGNKKKAAGLTVKGPDHTLKSIPEGSSPSKHATPAPPPPTGLISGKSLGKRSRGVTDTPTVEHTSERAVVNMRSNTIVPATRTAAEFAISSQTQSPASPQLSITTVSPSLTASAPPPAQSQAHTQSAPSNAPALTIAPTQSITPGQASPTSIPQPPTSTPATALPPKGTLKVPAPVPGPQSPQFLQATTLTRANSGPLNSESTTPRHFSNADILNPFEEDDTEYNIRLDNNKIIAGTFGKIVEKITDDKFGDAQMLVVFLNTYRTFVSPTKLLNILILRYTTLCRYVEGQDQEAKQKAVRLRIMVVFKHWIEGHWQDWQDNDFLVEECKKFIQRTVIPSGLQKSADILTHLLQKKRMEVENDVQKLDTNIGKAFDLWSFSVFDIAVQITLIEFNFYKSIKLHEFLKLAWTKKNAKKRAPNILAFIEFFNKMAEWIKAEIVAQDVLQRRIDKLGKFLELAEKLLALNNFNGVAEIVAALDSAPIHRLRKTWEGLPEAKKVVITQLREIVGPSRSYAKLRERLHTANPPCIPYLGMYLTDLTFIHDGNPDILPETRMANFGKCVLISDVLREIQLYQQTKFTQVLNPQFKKFIVGFAGFSEEESYDLSLEIEPRVRTNSTPEKVETDSPKVGDTLKSSKGSRLKLSVITTLEHYRTPTGPPTPPSPSAKPPQEMLTLTSRLVKKRWMGKKTWIDLSDEPFFVHFQLLGTSAPLIVRLPPKCTTTQAISIFEETFRGVAISCQMVVMPTAQYPAGKVLAEDEGLDGYCLDKKLRDGFQPVLMIFGKPASVRVGVSRSNSVERLEDIVLDLAAPIFALIPILQNVFGIREEFAFLYIEGASVARWMNMGRTLENQALDPDKGLLLIFPLVNLLQRNLASLGRGEKSGYLFMKKKDQHASSYLRGTHKRFFALHDHFLMWFADDNPEAIPRGVISLDHFSAKVAPDGVLMLLRSFKGFTSTISKYNCYKFTGISDEDTTDWYTVVQQCRGSVGDQVIFGIPLAAAVTKRGANNLPIVVLKTITYLTENDFLDEKLFKEQNTSHLLEFYIDQFDQGVNVDFTHLRQPATVAQLLVVYITMLPDPLLTFDLFDQFVQQGSQYAEVTSTRRPTNETERKNITAKKKSAEDRLGALVAQLPVVNRAVLCFLLEFLNEIISKARENCADDTVAYASTRSLASIFGPACMRPSSERGQVTPMRNECELVMQQLILQNAHLFSSGSEVKIIRRAKIKNMLQQSTQSIHLTAQIAENAQQLVRDPSNSMSDLELKSSKDPQENEKLQAVYDTLKKKQALRNQQNALKFGSIAEASESNVPIISPPPSPPSIQSIFPVSSGTLPRPPSPPRSEEPVSFIPHSLPPPTPPPSTANIVRPHSPSPPISLSPPSTPSLSPTPSPPSAPSPLSSLARSPSLESQPTAYSKQSPRLVLTDTTQVAPNEAKPKGKKPDHWIKLGSKSDEDKRPRPQDKHIPEITPANPHPKPHERLHEKQQTLQPKHSDQLHEKTQDKDKDKDKDKDRMHVQIVESPTDTLQQRHLEKLLEKPWPKPPPMPEYRLSRRISALKKFNRDRSSKKNSKPPIDIFEGEQAAQNDSYKARLADLRNMFERPDDSPKLPVSNSKIFPPKKSADD